MGIYYKLGCDDLRETIDPGDIDDLGVKLDSITCLDHPFGPLAIFAMATRWSGKTCRLLNDSSDQDEYYDKAWRDVTADVIAEFMRAFPTRGPLRYTGKGGPSV